MNNILNEIGIENYISPFCTLFRIEFLLHAEMLTTVLQ
jgi:hypothetical protein